MAMLHALCMRLHVGTKCVGCACANDMLQGARMPFWFARAQNQDCKFKVSRDGTKLEPAVCQRLLDKWEAPLLPPWAPTHARRGHSHTCAVARAPRSSCLAGLGLRSASSCCAGFYMGVYWTGHSARK
jgi:hypothetical protein